MSEPAIQIDANVDDMDPRLWPAVLDALLAAGAQDAWVTPIVMKKGRPAFTVSVLCDHTTIEAARSTLFAHTTTIGLRQFDVEKFALERSERTVDFRGHKIRVKSAFVGGETVNQSIEWDDVVAAAAALSLSPKVVLAAATAAAQQSAS